MKKINFNQFLQTTILENSTIEPNEFDLTFAELICGKNSKTYKHQFINYLKLPQKSNIKNKQTKEIFAKSSEENKELAAKFDLIIQHQQHGRKNTNINQKSPNSTLLDSRTIHHLETKTTFQQRRRSQILTHLFYQPRQTRNRQLHP